MFKFFITANINVRAKRRFNEYKDLKKITYKEVLKSFKIVINQTKREAWSPKKTKDSILINTTKLSKKVLRKIKALMDKKLNN